MPNEAASAAFSDVTIADDAARGVVARAHAEELCAGHFPGAPLVPGAYLAGLMAELGERLLAARAGAGLRLAEIEDCLFHAPVVPRDEIVVEARVVGRLARGFRVAAEVRSRGARAARGRLRFEADA